MNRHERRKTKAASSKFFRASIGQITEMCDAFFSGVDVADDPHGRHGFVEMYTNEKGKRAVEAIFPNAFIDWKEGSLLPGLRYDFSINVPDVASAVPDHRLPLEITRGASLDDAAPEALAFLLAMAAKRQGARVAYSDRDGQVSL
jgi:hypothetical protein